MQSAQKPEKKGRGCFFYGCITLIVVTVLVVGVTVGGAYYGVKKIVQQYTDDKPMPIPVVEAPAAELAQLQSKIEAFETASKNGLPTPALVLTDHDINALIGSDERFKEIRGKTSITIKDGKISGMISIPLEELGFKGRFINGSATFALSKSRSGPELYIEEMTVAGQAPPEQFMHELRKQNLLETVRREPENRELVEHLERIDVGANSITIYAPTSKEPEKQQ